MAAPTTYEPIPHPPSVLMLGNLFDLNAAAPVQGMMQLARQHGPIFELELPGRQLVVVSSAALADELCDETRFDKLVWSPLQNVRPFTGDGLFTAWTQEPNWRKAHNILLPNFGMAAMRGYMPAMVDIATQLMQKWERLNPDDAVNVPDDMTRLTLDTIGLCGFDYRFNSFYREGAHPFVASMVRTLGESLGQLSRLPVQTRLMVRARRQFQDDIAFMNTTVDAIIHERRAKGGDVAAKKDLLGYMLTGVDKESGEHLDDINIRHQIITFLIAGHETTSGLLSFAIYFLLKHPEVLRRAYAEVDRVLGGDLDTPPTYEQVHQLRYVMQILQESLRLWPTAPAFALSPYEETVLGGRYQVDKRYELMVLIPMLHRDPAVWGANAELFDPEHFSLEAQEHLPPHAYKPFGNGQRACIGRQFALQEASLVLGMLLQRFEFIDHTNYELQIKETLTLKPSDFTIKVRPREQRPAVVVTPPRVASAVPVAVGATPRPATLPQHDTPLLVLYGSNLGAAEDLAQQIGEDGQARGFVTTIAPLDDYTNKLPKAGAVVIVTSSYNGTPPDNAAQFVAWLRDPALGADAAQGVRYTVFGCGNRDWAATYQAVPKFIDGALAAHGAQRVFARGEGDARDDFDGQFRGWYADLWTQLAELLGIAGGTSEPVVKGQRFAVEAVTAPTISPFATEYAAQALTIRANRELHTKVGPAPSERSTRHIEIALPAGVSYHTGDHLGILPRNAPDQVRRVAARFGFTAEDVLRIRNNATSKTYLPLDQPIAVARLLADYIELQEVATRSHIRVLLEYTECPPEKARLLALAGDDEASVARYRQEVFDRHLTVIDLLEANPACNLPFNIYLEMASPLRPRYFSISSSPLVDAQVCSITVGVIDAPARSGKGTYHGVCSSYLAQAAVGSTIAGYVRRPSTPFYPPEDTALPLIMVGAGTGLAPFRGFLQERAAQHASGAMVGPALLFYGYRHPQQDFLYADELVAFAEQGIARLISAASRHANQPRRYVQAAISAHQDEVWHLLQAGAVVYVCGDAAKMAPAVRATFCAIYRDKTGGDDAAATQWLAEMEATRRYRTDVWPSS